MLAGPHIRQSHVSFLLQLAEVDRFLFDMILPGCIYIYIYVLFLNNVKYTQHMCFSCSKALNSEVC